MGREIKRVPLDFKWDLNKVWKGFINPYRNLGKKCPDCESGYSKEAEALQHKWYGSLYNAGFKPEDRGSIPFTPSDEVVRQIVTQRIGKKHFTIPAYIEAEAKRLCAIWNSSWSHHLNDDDVKALVDAERLHDFTHEWVKGKGWMAKNPPVIPTARQVNEWSLFGMGHDSINCHVVITAECERLNVPHTCATCNGDCTIWNPGDHEKYESWKQEEPPTGDGYQLWGTVSEGSPISPVFATPEELADWLANSGEYDRRIDHGITYDQWLKFIKGPAWAPSFVGDGNSIQNGVQAAIA